MIESLFIIVLVFALMMNLMAFLLRQQKLILLFLSLMVWLALVVSNSLYIEVPGVNTYAEIGAQFLAYMFIFTDIIFLFVVVLSSDKVKNWWKGDWGG